jgi:hypothetical protein
MRRVHFWIELFTSLEKQLRNQGMFRCLKQHWEGYAGVSYNKPYTTRKL